MDSNSSLNNFWECDTPNCSCCEFSILLPTRIIHVLKSLVYISEQSGSNILILPKTTIKFKCSDMMFNFTSFANPFKLSNTELRNVYNTSEIADYGNGNKEYNIFVTRTINILQNIKMSKEIKNEETMSTLMTEYIAALIITNSIEHFKMLTEKIISYLT